MSHESFLKGRTGMQHIILKVKFYTNTHPCLFSSRRYTEREAHTHMLGIIYRRQNCADPYNDALLGFTAESPSLLFPCWRQSIFEQMKNVENCKQTNRRHHCSILNAKTSLWNSLYILLCTLDCNCGSETFSPTSFLVAGICIWLSPLRGVFKFEKCKKS